MSFTGVATSPLQAAREWRGVSLIVAARNSGLTLTQAEALEEGTLDAFRGIDEMIAAAVLYGASLGIGRDEALALLDRTIESSEDLPMPAFANAETLPSAIAPAYGAVEIAGPEFSTAVQQRSAEIAARDDLVIAPSGFDNIPEPKAPMPSPMTSFAASLAIPVPSESDIEQTGEIPIVDVPIVSGELPVVDATSGLAPSQSDSLRAALELDPQYRQAWEQASSELEQWAATGANGRPSTAQVVWQRIHAQIARFVGNERANKVDEARTRAIETSREGVIALRQALRKSEHATLLVALGAGVLLIALLVAIASALDPGTPEPTATSTASTQQQSQEIKPISDASTDTKSEAKPRTPLLKPTQISLRVLNAGSQHLYAETISDRLHAMGYKIEEVGNSKTDYATSVILYPEALRREAERLAKRAKISTMDQLPGSTGSTSHTITVIVV